MMIYTGRLILTILCLGLVVILHEFGHLLVARWLGVRVERFTVGFGQELFGVTIGQTRYSVCLIPLGGMVKLAGEFMDERQHKPDEFFSQAWYRRVAIALAGPAMNYLLAFVLFAWVAAAWGIYQPSDQPIVGELIAGLPAAEAHLQVGDRIQAIDGQAVKSWDDMAQLIHQKPEQKVKVDVVRSVSNATQHLQVTLIPRRDPQHGVGLIGIMPRADIVHADLRGSLTMAAAEVKLWTLQPLNYLSQKVRHFESPKELAGPIGIAQMVSKATKEGMAYILTLIAIISTGLGLFNLFPIPVLDGGHIFLYTVEGLIRRPLSRRVMQVANAIGLSLVLTIFLYASYQDVLRLGFWK